MFVLKYQDGSFKEVAELDPNHPDPALMVGLVAVYQVHKEWLPQTVLRPKLKEERQRLNRAPVGVDGQEEESQTEEPEFLQVSFL